MLERAERAAEPGIITDIHQHLRFGQKFRDFSTKDRLVADECPYGHPCCIQDVRVPSRCKIGHGRPEHVEGRTQKLPKRNIFTEGHQVAFVVEA